MKLHYLGIIGVAVLLNACASGSYQWYKDGVSRHATNNQVSRCRYDIDMARDIAPDKAQVMLENCMQKEGYRWVKR